MRMKVPEHPVPELTTFELRDYRSRLEDALRSGSLEASMQTTLESRLAEVIGEQDSRTRDAKDLNVWSAP